MNTIDKVMMVAGAAFAVFALPFVAAHVQETWDAPEYPYTGFTPDCPVHYDNTLPPADDAKGGAR